ncbi:MAG: hypothetical protein V4596_08380 [Bdellovibrionota bacterium]
MKTFTLIAALLLSLAAHASKDRGGGDMCEDRIKTVRADIGAWIDRGGPQSLRLPAGITVVSYSSEMKRAIEKSQIECVSKGDRNYPVEVLGRSKVCRFDSNEMLITCDFAKISVTSEEEFYRLVHHEPAGLAKIENPDGADSNYEISNQLSRFLVDTVVKRLAVTPAVSSEDDDTLRSSTRHAFAASGLYYCFNHYGDSINEGYRAFDKILANKSTTIQLVKDKKRPRINAHRSFQEYSGQNGKMQIEFLLSKDLKSILSMKFVSGEVRSQAINTGTIEVPKYETQSYLYILQKGSCRKAGF